MATQGAAVDAASFVAFDRGYFREAGVDLEYVQFSNASEMIPALATGQLEANSIAANPAAWNAVARGVPVKVVLDKGSYRPGEGDQWLAVRKDLYDAGRGQRLTDLRELSLAITPPGKGTSTACGLGRGLQQVGMTLDDLNIQPITFPDMVPAFANRAIDAAMIAEPFLTRAIRQGSTVKVLGLGDLYPNFTISTVGLAPSLYDNRSAARGYVRAYIRGIRDYLNATRGRSGEAERTAVYEILASHTGLDLATIREMSPTGFDPNGLVNQEAMLYCYQFFREQGLVPEPVSEAAMAALWGTELTEEVLAELGRVSE